MNKRQIINITLLACAAVLVLPSAHAEHATSSDDQPARKPLNLHLIDPSPSADAQRDEAVAIGGYSPVSYFEKHRAEKGSPDFRSVYAGNVYYLASAEQLETFEAAPEQYVPEFAELCPYSLALGRQVAIDPTRFKIVDGHLLLFHNSAELDALEKWNAAPNEDELLRKARQKYMVLRF